MRVLMISPHPVYSPRGTPISVFNRCLALCALGHQVDLVTYPVGEDIPVPGLTYRRSSLPGVRTVAVGPSWAKIGLDLAVGVRALQELPRCRKRYDVVHTHEEGGLLGPPIARVGRIPHVYDMGNDWSVVLQNYGLGARHPITGLARSAEVFVVRRAHAVIAHFPAVAAAVRAKTAAPIEVVYNISLDPDPDDETVRALRQAWSPDGRPLAMYTGTLEDYQGLPLLLEAMGDPRLRASGIRLVVVGGRPPQIHAARETTKRLGVDDAVHFVGTLPSHVIPACLAAADVVVSPRRGGTNTPLKVFAYLRSGTPVVATAIESHTQVLDDDNSILVPPSANGIAQGLIEAVDPLGPGDRIRAGAALAASTYSAEHYLAGVARAYEHVGGETLSASALSEAAARLHSMIPRAESNLSALLPVLEIEPVTVGPVV